MFSKIISAIGVFIIGIILLGVIFRNPIIRFYLKDYAGKTVKGSCEIDKVNLWFDYLSISGLKLCSKDFNISAKNIEIRFKFQRQSPAFYINDINLSGITLKINQPESVRNISKKQASFTALPVLGKTIRLNLENINIDLKSKSLEINSSFSIIAEIGPGLIYLKDAYIHNFDIHSQDFEIKNLDFKKFRKDTYLLKIPVIRIKDKKFTDFLIPVKSVKNHLIFPKAKNPFIGLDGYASAKIDFKGYENLCAIFNFKNISFEKIVDLFASEDAAFRGLFDGLLEICLSPYGIERVEANFKNKGNGFINIKKESSFAFLKSYLDVPSYNALIDNFKNYEYNIGVIDVKKSENILGVSFNFTSASMGKRNITINFHDILGGSK